MKKTIDKIDGFIMNKIIELESSKNFDNNWNIASQYWQFIDKKEKLEYCQELLEEFKKFIS